MNISQAQIDYAQGHTQGYKAYQAGLYRNDNPYIVDDEPDLYEGWDDGYSDAKEEAK